MKTDDKGNAYLLLLPGIGRQTDPSAEIPRPRDVLRISADGKEKTKLSPTSISKLASATNVTTAAIALDADGLLSMLVWARWRNVNGGEDKKGQYIVSFDKDGDGRTEVEVDWRQMGVMQFEAFGSGKFLLRGRWTNAEEIRLAILSPTGGLQDIDWSEQPVTDEPLEEGKARRPPSFGQMVRGGDGRVYLTQPGARPDEVVVHALSASGLSEKLFHLRATPRDLPLVGMKAAGNRLAAVYHDNAVEKGRWWIAVYGTAAGDPMSSDPVSPLAVYGPAPAAPVAYRVEDSRDRFTFLKNGHFVTMAP